MPISEINSKFALSVPWHAAHIRTMWWHDYSMYVHSMSIILHSPSLTLYFSPSLSFNLSHVMKIINNWLQICFFCMNKLTSYIWFISVFLCGEVSGFQFSWNADNCAKVIVLCPSGAICAMAVFLVLIQFHLFIEWNIYFPTVSLCFQTKVISYLQLHPALHKCTYSIFL